MTNEQIQNFFNSFYHIKDVERKHGKFVANFTKTIIIADSENLELLRVPALAIIEKYNLRGE